ncbi:MULTISPECIES: hypothetical protein [Hyphomicrobiales]|uniref:Uncharacterized protein n=1 Tax=Bosea massiliensis TaxID=151419 RepID=A0ABW0P2F4_9HYPH
MDDTNERCAKVAARNLLFGVAA